MCVIQKAGFFVRAEVLTGPGEERGLLSETCAREEIALMARHFARYGVDIQALRTKDLLTEF